MIIFGFFLMFSYIIYNLYFDILDVFIKSQTVRILILFALVFLIPQTIIIPLIFRNISVFATRLIYTILCLLVYIFCIFIIKDIFVLFSDNVNFWLPINIFIFLLVLFCIHSFFNNKVYTTRYNIETNKQINMKVLFVSDLHIGNAGINEKQVKNIVSIINREKPDLLIFGGDIVETEDTFSKLRNYNDIFKQIETKNIYGVLGNHEFYFNNNPDNMAKLLKNNYGINILQDESKNITENLTLIGRNDYRAKFLGKERKELTEIIKDIDPDDFLLLIDHNPIDFDSAVENNIDLQVSGHIHGGQFFPFNIINKLFYENINGISSKKNSKLIVSSGVGTSGIPVRILTKKEVVVINIKEKQ